MSDEKTLRDLIARAIFEEPGADLDWQTVSNARREPWRNDAERAIEVVRQWLCNGHVINLIPSDKGDRP